MSTMPIVRERIGKQLGIPAEIDRNDRRRRVGVVAKLLASVA